MKADEIIIEMVRTSPIQQEWHVAVGDTIIHNGCFESGKMLVITQVTERDLIEAQGRPAKWFKTYTWVPKQEDIQKIYWDNVGGPTEMCEPCVETVCDQLTRLYKPFEEMSHHESSKGVTTKAALVPGLNALPYPETFTLLWCMLLHGTVRMEWPWGTTTAKWDWKNMQWVKNG